MTVQEMYETCVQLIDAGLGKATIYDVENPTFTPVSVQYDILRDMVEITEWEEHDGARQTD